MGSTILYTVELPGISTAPLSPTRVRGAFGRTVPERTREAQGGGPESNWRSQLLAASWSTVALPTASGVAIPVHGLSSR